MQNIFQCEYCKNKIASKDAMKIGSYNKDYIMGVGAENTPKKAIPFEISLDMAKERAKKFVRKNTSHFSDIDMENFIDEELSAYYVSYWARDISMKGTVKSEKGDITLYQEIINWHECDSVYFDYYLLDRIDPWDFGKIARFNPEFTEGNIKIASTTNLPDGPDMLWTLLMERFESEIKDKFGFEEMILYNWACDIRKHNTSYALLPVYYLEYEKGRNSIVRIAVNGQNGKVAASFVDDDFEEKNYFLEEDFRYYGAYPPQATVRGDIVPVKYVKGPFLYKIVSLEEGLEKPEKSFFQKIFPFL